MLIKIFTLLSLISSVFGTCFTENDVINSDKLFMYQGNVYDITGYKHPGGKSDLLKTVGQDLDIFFKNPKYKFHVRKSSVTNDLKSMYVGNLSTNCIITTQNTVTTGQQPTSEPVTTSKNTVITNQQQPTSEQITTSKNIVTTNQPITTEQPFHNDPIVNSSSKIQNIGILTFLSLFFSYYL